MHFDDVLKQVGEFGPYQKRVYFLIMLSTLLGAFHAMSPIFILGDQDHRCKIETKVPSLSDTISHITSENDILGKTEPTYTTTNNISHVISHMETEECHITYYINGTNSTHTVACSAWSYDQSVFTSTAISQYDLVCDRKHLQSHAKMAYLGGFLAAACFCGFASDQFGRRPVYIACLIVVAISGLGLAWSPNILVFAILRFVIGFSGFGLFTTSFVIGLEIVGTSKRIWSGILIELIFCVGELMLCLFAFFIRDWMHLQIVISALHVVGFIAFFILNAYFSILPESPRWLLSEGRQNEALAIVYKIAKSKNKTVPDGVMEKEAKFNFKKIILPILKSKTLILRFIVISLGWFVISMTYFGITYNVGKIGGDIYVNFTFSVIVEFIGYSSCIILSEKLGRKFVHCGSLLVAGMACLGTIFTTMYATDDLNWTTITLAMIGKLCISAAFGNVYLYTTELFPTGIRSFALTSANIGGRIGGLVSPYIADLGTTIDTDFGKALPLIIFGIIALGVGTISLVNPETRNTKLPENIDEATTFRFSDSVEVEIDDFSSLMKKNDTTIKCEQTDL